MKREIERRFLVRDDSWRQQASPGVLYRQAYLHAKPGCTVRVRLAREPQGDLAWLTIKGKTQNFSRDEFEYPIPVDDAEALFSLASAGRVEKWRHKLGAAGFCWEIDVFAGENAGLVLAEIELPSEEARFEQPEWLGEEVTADQRYANANLAAHPYSLWRT